MEPIVRHSAPTKLDTCPHGTECLVFLDGHVWDRWIQYGTEEDPRWEYMGRQIIEIVNNNKE